MELNLIRKIQDKENKTEIDWTLLKYHKTLSIISEILVTESKLDISSEQAIIKIRDCINNNL